MTTMTAEFTQARNVLAEAKSDLASANFNYAMIPSDESYDALIDAENRVGVAQQTIQALNQRMRGRDDSKVSPVQDTNLVDSDLRTFQLTQAISRLKTAQQDANRADYLYVLDPNQENDEAVFAAEIKVHEARRVVSNMVARFRRR